ncbi:hypothetical protein [uncultured Leifsonia sp.]|uniref:hypothetical protein n=1 Tax=uncultured Leifsonia sp. TaxID=340359 RepID=UPI0025D6AF18|nr:hypothetical protein [uncultured Leifsonia sp.]
MSISIPGKVIVFDYGEVISVTPSEADRTALVGIAGGDAEQFWPAYWRHRNALDQGTLTIQQYWRASSASSARAGRTRRSTGSGSPTSAAG